MPMKRKPIRPRAFVAFHKKKIHLGLSPCAAYTAEAIGDDARGPDQFRAKERYQRQQNACGITTRTSNQIGFYDRVSIKLRQSINRIPKEKRGRVIVLIELFVNGGIFDSKIGA